MPFLTEGLNGKSQILTQSLVEKNDFWIIDLNSNPSRVKAKKKEIGVHCFLLDVQALRNLKNNFKQTCLCNFWVSELCFSCDALNCYFLAYSCIVIE